MFKVGDVVIHLSGGPAMVVLKVLPQDIVTPTESYLCEWWQEGQEYFTSKTFIPESIKPLKK